MNHERANFSLAVAAGGLLGFVVLASGVWHPKLPAGGLTQVGRHASLSFADGSVMNLDEPDTDLDILRRRRMGGWKGHEFRQVFIMADGEEMEVLNNRPGVNDAGDLDSGNQLILAANTIDLREDTTLEGRRGVQVASLQTDEKHREIAREVDGKDAVITDLIDGKDRVITDNRDAKDAPVFALTPLDQSLGDERLDMVLLGDPGSDWNSLRTISGTGIVGFGTGVPTGGNAVSVPPIGLAVPEPSALSIIGVAGALACAGFAWKRKTRAA